MSGADPKAAATIARLAGLGFLAARAGLARSARALAEAEARAAAHRALLDAAPSPQDAAEGAAQARWLVWHALTAARLAADCDRARAAQAEARAAAAHALARSRAADHLAAVARSAARRRAEARAERAAPPPSVKGPLSPGA